MCGSTRVTRQRVAVQLRGGRVISNVEADVCAVCGERYYDAATMRRLEADRESRSRKSA